MKAYIIDFFVNITYNSNMKFIKTFFIGLALLLVGFGVGYLTNMYSRFEIVEKGSRNVQTSESNNSNSNNNSNSPVSNNLTTNQPTTQTPPVDSTLTSFKSLNIPSLKQTQQPGPKVRITEGFFKVTGRTNNYTEVNSGVEGLKIIFYDQDMIKALPSYNPRLGDLIKVTGDFGPLIANPPAGYQFIDYYLQTVTKVEVV
jgi:hypothetical protein